MDNMNNSYQDITTSFVLNTVLHHVGMLWIIETNQHLEYDMDKHDSYWMTGGPWYNTSICEKIHGNVFEEFIRNERTDRYTIMFSIDDNEKRIHQKMMTESAVVIIQYHKIQQQKH